MDTQDHELDKITSLVTDVCESKFAKLYFNFIDNEKCEITEFVMSQNNFVEVFDLSDNSHFIGQSIIVNGEDIRHFAGIPLTLFNGDIIGVLYVMDTKPKKLSAHQKSLIELIANDIIAKIEKAQKQDGLKIIAKQHEDLNKELNEFISIASHDLKSPVNAIKNLINWIEEDTKDGMTEDHPKHYKMIKNSVARLNRLLTGLGNYTQISREESIIENISLKVLVDDCCATLSVSDKFVFEVDECLIELPRPHLQILLSQLISNAVKHHDKGEGHIKVRCISNVNNYELSVIDDGPGIPAELHVKIFKPFQTLKSKDEIESSGLGLAIVKKIMKLYSGEAFLESTVNFGATFTVVWPKNKTRQNERQILDKTVSSKDV
jgi:signal transduction histidine kinase